MRRPPRKSPPTRRPPPPSAGWDRVAAWYDKLVGDEGSDYPRDGGRDARRLDALADGTYDAAACVMAVQDTDGLEQLCGGLARALRPGGHAVFVMMHPCFRVPRQSEWGWDEAKKTQYRRIDRYATSMTIPIATHPGREPGQQTLFYHRPLADYVNALGQAGLAVVACEELLTHRRSDPGSHSRGENRAAQEIPIFLALKAIRL